ncbi:hypothetical protein SAMN05660909_04737 [Chitinophaga terrae (ex Kim and Jung 2007)]|uniref:Uncharacterized protein n=1 Tax=Chitinophaga terrae (ex Kim and Jung 2007) TaxID=408074 RepID=A0A1H4FYV6_9BACT|nr:hypothetical protein [Chitinophaga terrae (ex Kim and Jung 2007)]GEP92769.1 hypothetical protein CTE07_44140 [Chitinophaga terrae (ex Kim and Jung 2007)]SEB01672.1 hypothetical protein SAMN05660909_04737 [Chitinophaga terrae (ex Kim and Jung 2007)]
MKRFPKLLMLGMLCCLSTAVFAQKIKLQNGDLSVFEGQKELNVEFTYDNLKVGKEDEADYVKRRTAEYNNKEAGKGDNWAKAWVDDRKNRFEPKFDELFNENGDIKVGSYPSAKYTMVFHTTFIEPGFNVGVVRKNSYIDAEVTIVETASRKEVAKISIDNAPGRMMGMDFDTGMRITESYAVSGKKLAKFVRK